MFVFSNYYDPDGCTDLSDSALEARALQDLDRSPQPENSIPEQNNLPVIFTINNYLLCA